MGNFTVKFVGAHCNGVPLNKSVIQCELEVHKEVATGLNTASGKNHIGSFQPESYISTMIYSWDIPFWSETFDMQPSCVDSVLITLWNVELSNDPCWKQKLQIEFVTSASVAKTVCMFK